MKLSECVKPISYLKAHAPEVIRGLSEGGNPVIITLHGEAKAVLQDITQYEETQETMALLKILAMSNKQVKEGKFSALSEVIDRVLDQSKNEA